ncbi:MAG: hypothetical protein ABJH93_09170, partial [Roseibium sp.]|uniref:hypothetical protein n=1 Tax=Roseibium sp. TaxID=1936156 RepID=UPI00329A3371
MKWARTDKKSGNFYRGLVEEAESFMPRWLADEAKRSRLRHAAEDAKNGDKGRGVGVAVLTQQLSTNPGTIWQIGWLGIGSNRS